VGAPNRGALGEVRLDFGGVLWCGGYSGEVVDVVDVGESSCDGQWERSNVLTRKT
jgi:hypothetical protein